METQKLSLIITSKVLETLHRGYSSGWEVYAAVYKRIDSILRVSPQSSLKGGTLAPTISLSELVTDLKNHFVFDSDAITDERVKLLVMIWSYKTQMVITSEFFCTANDFGLMHAVLEECGAFEVNRGNH